MITGEGVSPSRVVLGHLDEHLDQAYHRDLAAAGAVLEYDTFGAEFYWGDGYKEPSDAERMEHLAKLVNAGLASQIVLGCDVWTKSQLKSYGGMGYEHLISRIAPMLQSRFGFDDTTMSLMLVETPRRLLDR